ncbi:MAG: hypothetical protein IPL49_21985 [Saprospirales bacterium]|nr:hypothetical protein [Saprospirales bacterium]
MYVYKSLLLAAALLFTSCEVLLFEKDSESDPYHNFEALWKEVDEGYSFFSLKQINWDSIYQVYRPQVQADMGSEELFNLFSDMLYTPFATAMST